MPWCCKVKGLKYSMVSNVQDVPWWLRDLSVMHCTTQACQMQSLVTEWKGTLSNNTFHTRARTHTHTYTLLYIIVNKMNKNKCTQFNSKVVAQFGVLNGLCSFPPCPSVITDQETKKDSTTQLVFTPFNTWPLITERSAKKGKEANLFAMKKSIVVWPGSPSPAIFDIQILHRPSEGLKQWGGGSHFFTGTPSE